MSHAATNWAVQQRGIKPAAKIVLWQLCDRFHADNGCFPSQELLAEDCELSRSSLNDQLLELEAAGLIQRQRRHDTGRRRESTRYRFKFEVGFPFSDPCPNSGHGSMSENDPDPCPNSAENHVRNSDTNLVREPVKEPKIERDARERAIDPPVEEAIPEPILLDRIRKSHPQAAHADQDEVIAAWKALDVEERAAAARLIEPWLASKTGKHPLGLAKYLRQKLWTLLPEAQPAKPSGLTVLPAFKAAWWFVWLRRVGLGEVVTTMSKQAEANGGWTVEIAAMPSQADIDSLVAVELNSPEYITWQQHLASVGVRLPRPLGAGAVYMPSKTPAPGFGAVKQQKVA